MIASRSLMRATAVWAAVAFIVTVAIAVYGVSKAPGTPFDEAAHLDYVVKLAHGDMPKVYEQYGQTVLGELACDNPRGEAWAGLEPCGSPTYTPGLAPFGGLSTATNYAPTYYALTAVPYRVCEETTSLHPRVCGRVANTLWLGAAAAGFFVLMAMLGCAIVPALLVSIGSSVVPALLLQGITVNPDAAVQAMVAWLAVLAVWLSTRSKVAPWRQLLVLGVSGVVAVTAKETALVGYVVIMLMVGYVLTRGRSRADQVKLWAANVATVGAVVALAAVSRLLQPTLRGSGGANVLEELSKVPLHALDDGALLGFTSSMAPFTGLVWAPLAGPYLFSISALITGLTWALALQIRLPRKVEGDAVESPAVESPAVESPAVEAPAVEAPAVESRAVEHTAVEPPTVEPGLVESERDKSFPVVATMLAWLLPSVLVVLTWLSSRSIPVQQRYYMATATLLLVMGTATTTNRWLRWLVAGVMALTTVLVLQSLVAT